MVRIYRREKGQPGTKNTEQKVKYIS